MNKIGKLLREHDLQKELSGDINKLFEADGLECSEEETVENVDNICSNLKLLERLSEKDLSYIAGGEKIEKINGAPSKDVISAKPGNNGKERSVVVKIADLVIRATSTVVGCVLGGAGGAIVDSEITYTNTNENKNSKSKNFKVKDIKIKTFPITLGTVTGGALGYKLGRSISNKLGLS